ncbi:MAG TPA: PRC-barrel domain-containing protein, partial [Friedmanniella sp.]
MRRRRELSLPRTIIGHVASATSSTIFVSRIRGLPVLDASGDQVGRLRDVLVQRRAGMLAPRV